MLGDACQHARPDLLRIVKSEHAVRPAFAGEHTMGTTGFAFNVFSGEGKNPPTLVGDFNREGDAELQKRQPYAA